MLSRTLYDAFRSISSGVYSDGRLIPPWDREFSPAVERDESIWAAFVEVATFAVDTSQRLDSMPPAAGRDIGGVFVVRSASGDSPYQIFADASRAVQLARDVSREFAVELIVRRRAHPVFPPLPESAA